ncbi:ubiquitin-specific protease doa4, partial [Rhizoclosmatium hyalinum]
MRMVTSLSASNCPNHHHQPTTQPTKQPPPSLPAPAKERVRTPGGHSRAASNSNATDSNSNDAPPEPRTVADLNKLSNINLVPAQHTPKRWCSTAATLFEKAVDARIMGDIDQNYILLLRGVSIVVEIIPKSAQFNPKEESYVDLKKNVQQYLNELEVLKKKVNDRHAEWAKSQSSQQQLSPPIPQQNTILTPTVAPFSTRSSTATNQEQIPPPVAPTSSQPQPQPQPTSTSATTDALMARLRALQPGGSANSSNNTQSTSTSSPSRVPLKQSPSLNNFASTTPASLSRPTTPMIVPSNQSFNSTNSRTASATDLLSTNAPAKLVRSPSNSQNQGASTRSLNDLKMTCAELHAGLQSIQKEGSQTKVLVLDVRPMEEYIGGHIRWIVDVPVKNGEVGSGVVHIEPEWLHDGVDTAHIMNCLRGFTQASDPRLMMFEYRNIYEIIVCYDGSSNSVFASPTLKNLVSALFVGERDMGKIVKSQPIVLDGGFNGWMEFVKRKGLRTENWIEIGDGVGGGGSSLGADGQPPSNSGTPKISPTSASYTPAPYTTPKVSQYAPVKPYLPTQASTGSLYGNDPTRRSSYLNPTQFDNPFMNFNAGLGGVAGTSYVGGGAGYPRLPGQQQGLQHSSSFSRGQGGYIGVTPDYPSLSPLKNAPAVPQKPSGISVSQQQQFPQPQVQQHGLQHQNSQSMLHQQQQQQFQQQQQYQQYQQQQQLQQLHAQQQYQAQQQQQQPLPPSIPAKPAQLPVQPQPQPTPPAVKKPPPPVPAKPRLSITSVELTSQTSPAYSNPSDFMPISQIGSIGVVGLKNLGNTCFINSTLQCLSGTVPLARYFLGGNYRKGINRSNPMGTKGVIVEEFSQIIKSMWGGQESIITPAQFKERIGEYAEQFKGTEQHDSQEFLSFLLDAVHEDLNIARSGDKAKAIDTKGQDDESIPDD